MLIKTHKNFLIIIDALGNMGKVDRISECSLNGLNNKIIQMKYKSINSKTLKSACDLLQIFDYINKDKKPDRTYISLSQKGSEMYQKITKLNIL